MTNKKTWVFEDTKEKWRGHFLIDDFFPFVQTKSRKGKKRRKIKQDDISKKPKKII